MKGTSSETPLPPTASVSTQSVPWLCLCLGSVWALMYAVVSIHQVIICNPIKAFFSLQGTFMCVGATLWLSYWAQHSIAWGCCNEKSMRIILKYAFTSYDFRLVLHVNRISTCFLPLSSPVMYVGLLSHAQSAHLQGA